MHTGPGLAEGIVRPADVLAAVAGNKLADVQSDVAKVADGVDSGGLLQHLAVVQEFNLESWVVDGLNLNEINLKT